MNNRFDEFLALHHQEQPLLIANAWDVPSALVFQKLHYKAVATSSAAVAEALGYSDGETMPFREYLLIARRIVASTTVPVSVDLEGGYGKDVDEIVANIAALAEAGVSGINIEDSSMIDGHRVLNDPASFAAKVSSVLTRLNARGVKVFVNLRTDSFLMNVPNALEDARTRIALYNTTGAHGIFLPCIMTLDDMRACVAASRLPVNVMCMPDLPAFSDIGSTGVKRISMGAFAFRKLYSVLEELTGRVVAEGNFKAYF